MLRILEERDFPVDELRLFASARSAGRTIAWQGTELTVEDADTASYDGLDLALFSAGATASRALAAAGRRRRRHGHRQLVGLAHGPRRAARGARGQRARAARRSPRASSPTRTARRWSPCRCSSRSTSRPGSRRWSSAPTRPCPAAGLAGVEPSSTSRCSKVADRRRRAHPRRSGASTSRRRRSSPSTIAFNVIPHAGNFVDDGLGETDEDQKLRNESRKILELPDLLVSVTCVRVPVFTGHSMSINARFRDPLSPAQAARGRSPTPPACELTDVPTPLDVTGGNATHVGRIRARPHRPRRPRPGPVPLRRQPPQGRRPQRRSRSPRALRRLLTRSSRMRY